MCFDKIIELRLFLVDNERTASWLARKCNVSPAAVKGWLDKRHYPSKKHRIMIEKHTGVEL